MGRATLIVIFGMMGVLGYLQLSLNQSLNSTTKNAVNIYAKQYARNIAQTEVNRLIAKLSNDTTYRCSTFTQNTVSDGYAKSTVKDTIVNGVSRVAINSIGYFSGQNAQVRAIAKVLKGAGIPPFIGDYSWTSGGNFKMSNGIIRDCCDSNKNANLHTNGNFTQPGGFLYGFVNHVGTYSPKNVLPPYNPGGLPVHNQVSPITIPSWSMADFAGRITDTYTGNLSINGPFALGTLENPKVIRVTGNLTLGSSTSTTGYGIFLVEGKTSGSGGATINPMDPNKTNVAIYGNLEMTFSNGTYANILLYSNSTLKISNGHMYGSLVSVGDSEMSNGSLNNKASTSILVPNSWLTGAGRTQFVSSYEHSNWEY